MYFICGIAGPGARLAFRIYQLYSLRKSSLKEQTANATCGPLQCILHWEIVRKVKRASFPCARALAFFFPCRLTFQVGPKIAEHRACAPGDNVIWSTPSPLHFLHAILYGWTQPPKNAFCRPPETRTTGTDCLPMLQAGLRYLRGRACPVGWPSAAPIPVDAGLPV